MRRDIEKAATRSHNFSRREGITDCQLAKNRDITQNPKPAALIPPVIFASLQNSSFSTVAYRRVVNLAVD